MNRWLAHHGILGQKWGIRRYQNEDGTWTEVGKKRRNFQSANKTYDSTENPKSLDNAADKANEIYRTWTDREKRMFSGEPNPDPDKWIDQEWIDFYYKGANKNKHAGSSPYMNVTNIKDIPISFVTVFKDENADAIGIGVRNDPKYRQVGAAYEEGKKAVKYWLEHNGQDSLWWAAWNENVGSQKTAKKLGFEYVDNHDGWERYILYRDKGEQWLKANGFK